MVMVRTFSHFAVVDLRQILVLHALHFVHQVDVLLHFLVVLDEVLLEVHNVFVGGFLRAEDVDWSEVAVVAALDLREAGCESGVRCDRMAFPHLFFLKV